MANTPQITISEFLSAFFPKQDEQIYVRAFKPKSAPDRPDNFVATEIITRRKIASDSALQDKLQGYNETRGIYFIVNSGGSKQDSITRFNAFFAEADDCSINEQHERLDGAPLKPSIRVETKKSVHAYWLLDGDCESEVWAEVQDRLASYFKGDDSLSDLNQCMRLPYFNHVDYSTEGNSYLFQRVKLVEFNKELRYTTKDMLSAFPLAEKGEEEEKSMRKVAAQNEFASFEERQEELARRIMSHITARLNSENIFDCQGICHNGVGRTALMFNPATGTVHCNKGCDYKTILRAFGLPDGYLPSSNSPNSQIRKGSSRRKAFPVLNKKALYGLAGEFVRAIYPHTESDEACLLAQFLAGFGNVIGRTAFYIADGARHYPNLYALMVGKTSAAKGSALAHVMNFLEGLDAAWAQHRVQSGLSSGEGLIKAVDDRDNPIDKRLLVIETEFASVLHMNKREGNTLSSVIRNLWDKGSSAIMTKKDPVSTTNAHVSIIGQITPDELERYLGQTEIANGYANRFIFTCVRRSKDLPDGGKLNEEEKLSFLERMSKVIEFSHSVGEMMRDEEASQLWNSVYPSLVADREGKFGKVTARARAQVLRLSMIYALLDCSSTICRVHLEAALALWQFCEDSAAYHFSGDILSDKAQKLLDAIRNADDEGLNKTSMFKLFGRKVKKKELDELLSEIQSTGAAYPIKRTTAGREEERWFSGSDKTLHGELREDDEESHVNESNYSSNSYNSTGKNTPAEEIAGTYGFEKVSPEDLFVEEEKAA